MALYLALDVGGTKTAAVLADDASVLARASGGSIKTLRLPPAEAAQNLRAVLAALESASGLTLQGRIARTCIGTSGSSAPGVRVWMQQAFAASVGGELLLLGDEVIALDAAFRGARGVLVIAGTGSNIVARASTGAMVHTGGWGPALADEGSGHWIGTEALRACFRAIDAAAPSSADAVSAAGTAGLVRPEELPALLQHMMAALDLPTLQDVIGAANAPGFASARLVPVVVAAARAGDALAQSVLLRAGRDLAALVTGVIAKMRQLEAAPGAALRATDGDPGVAFVGGILSHVPEVRAAMHGELRAQYGGSELQEEPVDPLEGALWHARGCP